MGQSLLAVLLLHLLVAVCQDTTNESVQPKYSLGVAPEQWVVGSAVARYLSLTAGQQFNPAITFECVNVSEVSRATVSNNLDLDFIIDGPVEVACLCLRGNWNPLATLLRSSGSERMNGDGATLVARVLPDDQGSASSRSLLRVRGAVVSVTAAQAMPTLAAAAFLAQNGVWLFNDTKMVVDSGSDDQTLAWVASGTVDVGIISAQRLAALKQLSAASFNDIEVLGLESSWQWQGAAFPLSSSTPVFPEWGLVARAGLASRVQMAVLESVVRASPPGDLALSNRSSLAALPGWQWPEGVAGWESALAYDAAAWLLSVAGLLEGGGSVGPARQCRAVSSVVDAVACPDGMEPMGREGVESSCQGLGRQCPAGARGCVCEPCVAQSSFRLEGVGPGEGVQCPGGNLCVQAPGETPAKVVLVDPYQREEVAVRCRVQGQGQEGGGGWGACTRSGKGRWEADLGGGAAGSWVVMEVEAGGRAVQGSPFVLELVGGECSAGEHRELDAAGVGGGCVCKGGWLRVGGGCVAAAWLLPLVIAGGALLLGCAYCRARRCVRVEESAPEWEIDIEELLFPEPRELLGQGSFGVVELALFRGTPVAVKTINPIALVQSVAALESPANPTPTAETSARGSPQLFGRRASAAGRFLGASGEDEVSLVARLASLERVQSMQRRSSSQFEPAASAERHGGDAQTSLKRSASHLELSRRVRRLSLSHNLPSPGYTASSPGRRSPTESRPSNANDVVVAGAMNRSYSLNHAAAARKPKLMTSLPRLESGVSAQAAGAPGVPFHSDDAHQPPPLPARPNRRSMSLGGTLLWHGSQNSASDNSPAAGAFGGGPAARGGNRAHSPTATDGSSLRSMSAETEEERKRWTRGSRMWEALTPMMKPRKTHNSSRITVKPPSIEELRREMMGEIHFLSSIRHPSIVTLMGAGVNHQAELCLVLEYTLKGSLYDLLRNKTLQCSAAMLLPILQDVVSGILFLHSATLPVIHGDIKSSNVLIDANFRGKVADAGMTLKRRYGMGGSPAWMAPELLVGKAPSPGSDVYAIGMLLYEAFSRKEPYEGEDLRVILEQVADKARPEPRRPAIPVDCPPKVKGAIEQCWAVEPIQRPQLPQLWTWLAEASEASAAEETERQAKEAAEKSSQKGAYGGQAHNVLRDVFPERVAKALLAGDKVEPEARDCVTIFFSDIVNFGEIQSKLRPEEVARMLDRLYTKYDHLSHAHGVFKVETIGDAYMAVTNLVADQADHSARMARFALAVIQAASETLVDEADPSKGCVITRAGMHAGPVVADVVGLRNPRYCLFGDTVNTASRMESNSHAGRIHCSEFTAQNLRRQCPTIELETRGFIDVKGKGKMHTFWVNGVNGPPLSPNDVATLTGNRRRSSAAESLAEHIPTDGDGNHVAPMRRMTTTLWRKETLMDRIQSIRPGIKASSSHKQASYKR